MPQEEQEITEKDFEKIAYRHSIIGVESNREQIFEYNFENLAQDSFELAKSYHKQELSKVLREARKELPSDEEKETQYSKRFPNWKSSGEESDRAEIYQEGAEWMRSQASLAIAALKQEMKMKVDYYEDKWERLYINYSNQAKELSEKDSIIAAKEEEINKLKWEYEQSFRNKSARENRDSDYDN